MGVTPGSLACDIIREALPAWVHRRLSEALRPVLDAEEDDRTPLPTLRSGSHAATPPTGGGATDISISTGCTVTDTLAPGDPAKGPPGDAAA